VYQDTTEVCRSLGDRVSEGKECPGDGPSVEWEGKEPPVSISGRVVMRYRQWVLNWRLSRSLSVSRNGSTKKVGSK
jgi:hypothetical protein